MRSTRSVHTQTNISFPSSSPSCKPSLFARDLGPRVPIELQLHVIKLALEVDKWEDSIDWWSTRRSLGLVNRAWYSEAVRCEEPTLAGEDVERVLSLFARDSTLALKVKRLRVRTEHSSVTSTPWDALIRTCWALESIEIEEDTNTAFFVTLASLPRLTHLTLDKAPARTLELFFSPKEVRASVNARFDSLHSLTIKDHYIWAERNKSPSIYIALTPFPYLQSLKVEHHDPDAYHGQFALFTAIPPTLSKLHLDIDIFHQRSPHAHKIVAQLITIAAQLKEVTLLNTFKVTCTQHVTKILPQYRIDNLISRLVNVHTLTIPTCAVSTWTATLAPLTTLVELNIVESDKGYAGDLTASDLVGALAGLTALKRLGLSAIAWGRWKEDEQNAAKEAAGGKGIKLKIIA